MKRAFKKWIFIASYLTFFIFLLSGCKTEPSETFKNTVIAEDDIYCFIEELSEILPPLDVSKTYRIHIKDENPDFELMRKNLKDNENVGVHLLLEMCTEPTQFPESAFEECNSIISCELPEQLMYLGAYCFFSCENLETIKIGKKLRVIGEQAFSYTNITEIELPDSLRILDRGAFSYTLLTSVTIPENCDSIYKSCFEECQKLKSVEILGAIRMLESYLFYDCISLEKVIIPDTVTEFQSYCFAYCENLEIIDYPKSLSTVCGNSYKGCKILKNIYFPDNEWVGKLNLQGCEALEEFIWDKEQVKEYDVGCFKNCKNLRRVKLYYGFWNYTVPEECFAGCENLQEVELFEGSDAYFSSKSRLYLIDDYCFANCTSLESFKIPSSVQNLGECVFYNCKKLKKMTIEKNLNSKHNHSKEIEPGIYKYGPFSQSYIEEIEFNISNQLPCYIANNFFCGATELKTVKANSYIGKIGKAAFYDCSKLTNIDLKNVEIIGSKAFMNCTSIEKANPTHIATIEEYAFFNCSNLKNLDFGGKNNFINNDFSCLSKFTIGEWAFYNCDLQSLFIPLGTEIKIGSGAFYGNKALVSITFGGSKDYFKTIVKNSNEQGNVIFLDETTQFVNCTDGTISFYTVQN